MPVGQVVSGQLAASGTIAITGEAVQGTLLSAAYSATADPTIVIDPSFPFRDDFELLFSPNLSVVSGPGPSPAPAPETLEMTLLGMGVLALARWRVGRRLAPPSRHVDSAAAP
jgi:hypothetical protein